MVDDRRHATDGGSAGLPVLQGAWRFRRWVIAATLLAAALGWGASQLQPVRYEATAEILLANPRDAGVFREIAPRGIDATRYARNQAQRLQSSAVAALTAEQIEGLTAEDVRERITATASADLDLISVTASGETAVDAAALANAVVDAYQDVVAAEMRTFADRSIAELEEAQVELQARVNDAQQLLDSAPDNEFAQLQLDAAAGQLIANQQLIERITVDAALYGAGVQLIEPAVPPESPVAPQTVMNTLVAALLGFAGAAALGAWRARALRSADHRQDAAEVLHVPLLGAVPELGELSDLPAHCPTVARPESPAAEAYRFVAAALEHTLDADVRTIVVTSAKPDDGKTTVALNLAVALNQAASPALLVDADVRQQALSKLTATNGRPGLVDLAEYRIEEVLQSYGEEWGRGFRALPPIVPAGLRNVDPTQFFRSTRYRGVLQRLHGHGSLVVIDAPPLLSVSDASAIAGSADGIVLVVNRGTPRHVLVSLQERLAFVGAPVLGYVFNRASGKDQGYYAYNREGGPAAGSPEAWGLPAGPATASAPPRPPAGHGLPALQDRDVSSAGERR